MALADSRFDVSANASSELSTSGYRFFVDLFLMFDKDNDGVLSETELRALLGPTPGLPTESSFARNSQGHISLQAW